MLKRDLSHDLFSRANEPPPAIKDSKFHPPSPPLIRMGTPRPKDGIFTNAWGDVSSINRGDARKNQPTPEGLKGYGLGKIQ